MLISADNLNFGFNGGSLLENVCFSLNEGDRVGLIGGNGEGNNLKTGLTYFSAVNVNRYVCTVCGYTEEWIDRDDLERVKTSKKAIKQ